MKIIISTRAEKELKKLSKIEQIVIVKKIKSLTDRTVANEEKLSGFSNIFRLRIGDLRIVYKKTREQIYIILIGHRRNIYQLLKRLF